jgi:hypothetical protein
MRPVKREYLRRTEAARLGGLASVRGPRPRREQASRKIDTAGLIGSDAGRRFCESGPRGGRLQS